MHKSIFVSSTFRDFQRERDLLQNKVEQRINELLQPSGVSFLDLRWGIDTTGETNLEKVVSICIAEVLHSHPFYVIMLGDTYGSTVDSAVVRSLYALNGLDYDGKEKSVTQIEIEATGVFGGDNQYILVLDRHIDRPADPRAQALKEQVLAAAAPENVYTYRAVEKNGTILPEDENAWIAFVAERICGFLKDQTTAEEPYAITKAKNTARQFRGRETVLQALQQAVETFDEDYIFRIYAPKGAGLTALLSKLYVQLQDAQTETAFCEAYTQLPLSFYGVLMQLGSQWGVPMEAETDLFTALNPEKRYFCILDGLEEILEDAQLQRLLRRDQIPDNCLLILTVSDRSEADFVVELPTKDDALALLDGVMQDYRKELPKSFRQYFAEHISPEMVRQPVLLREFISEICYLTEADYRKLGGSDDFMEALAALFVQKLDGFPESEQAYIQAVLQDGSEAQLWALGLMAVATGPMDSKLLMGILRSGGISCDMLALRLVKERFRDSVYCFGGDRYVILRNSFREAVCSCFTPEQLRWLRYLLVAYMAQNLAQLEIPQNFRAIAAQYLLLEDYQLLARLLEFCYLTGEHSRENGLRFAQLCCEGGKDAPGVHYRALAAEKNPYCCRWLADYAMLHLTELYMQNGVELFASLYETVAAEDEDDDTTADLLGILAHGLALRLQGREAQALLVRELKGKQRRTLPGSALVQAYLTACLRLNTKGAAENLAYFLEQLDASNQAVSAALGRILRYTVLMDGNMLAYKPQLQQLLARCEEFLDTCERSDLVSIAVPLLYLSSLLKVPLKDRAAVEAVVENGTLVDQPLSVHLLFYYQQFQNARDLEALQNLVDLVCVTLEDEAPLATVELFFVSRYLRRICYIVPQVLEVEETADFLKQLYHRFRELDNSELYLMKVIEMFYLGGLVCLYEGAEQGLALLEPLLSDARIKTDDLLSELEFFRQDAAKTVAYTRGAEELEMLEKVLQQRKEKEEY